MNKATKKERKKRGVEEWFNLYKERRSTLSDEEKAFVDSYITDIREGIIIGTRDENLKKLVDLDVRRECLEYEERIYYTHVILKKQPSHAYVLNGAKLFAMRRKYSWFKDILPPDSSFSLSELIRDEADGEAIDKPETQDIIWKIINNSCNDSNSEQVRIAIETENHIENILKRMRYTLRHMDSLDCPHPILFKKIYRMMLRGICVTGKHADELGISKSEVPGFRAEAIKWLQEEVAKEDLELREIQDINKRRKKHKAKKSTRKERKILYPKNEDNEQEMPRNTKIWVFSDGWLILVQDDQEPVPDEKGSSEIVKKYGYG